MNPIAWYIVLALAWVCCGYLAYRLLHLHHTLQHGDNPWITPEHRTLNFCLATTGPIGLLAAAVAVILLVIEESRG
jgi:hypothetical protein